MENDEFGEKLVESTVEASLDDESSYRADGEGCKVLTAVMPAG